MGGPGHHVGPPQAISAQEGVNRWAYMSLNYLRYVPGKAHAEPVIGYFPSDVVRRAEVSTGLDVDHAQATRACTGDNGDGSGGIREKGMGQDLVEVTAGSLDVEARELDAQEQRRPLSRGH